MSLNANLLQKELKISLDPCNFSFNSKSTTKGRGWSSRINVSLLMMRECQMLMNVSAVENDSYPTHLDSFYFHIHCSPQSQ